MPYDETIDEPIQEVIARQIDEAAFNAWPSIRQILYDGWILRFSRRYTKRANAVYPMFPSTLPVEEKVDRCEAIYNERKMAVIFRLTHGSLPDNLDALLEKRGYAVSEPSQVLGLPLNGVDAVPAPGPGFQTLRPDRWHRAFAKIAGLPPEKARIHEEIVSLIPGDVLFSAIVEEEETIAVGLGVMAPPCFGLFDLITLASLRRRGHGSKLVREMLSWAAQRGAATAYLQVVAANQIAQNMYQGLGFRKIFDYWYRVLDTNR